MGNVAKSGFQIGIVSRDLGSFLSLRDKFDKYKQNVGHLLSRFELELLAPCRDELLGLLAESVPAVLQLAPAQDRGRHGVFDLVEPLQEVRVPLRSIEFLLPQQSQALIQSPCRDAARIECLQIAVLDDAMQALLFGVESVQTLCEVLQHLPLLERHRERLPATSASQNPPAPSA